MALFCQNSRGQKAPLWRRHFRPIRNYHRRPLPPADFVDAANHDSDRTEPITANSQANSFEKACQARVSREGSYPNLTI